MLDEGESGEVVDGFVGEEVEVLTEGVGGELGVDAGDETTHGLGVIPLYIQLSCQLTKDRFDSLPERVDRLCEPPGLLWSLVLALGSNQCYL